MSAVSEPSPAAAPRYASYVGLALIALFMLAQPAGARADPAAADGVRREIAALLGSVGPARQPSADHGTSQALRTLYVRTENAPLWSHDQSATPEARALLHELQGAAAYGLIASVYGTDAIDRLLNGQGAGAEQRRWAQFDVRLSQAALRFVTDLHYGRVDPVAQGFNLQGAHAGLDLSATLQALSRSTDVRGTLATAEPPFYHYKLLKDALPRYQALVQHPELTRIAAPPPRLKIGDAYQGAPALRRLLEAVGDLPAANNAANAAPTFDDALSAGLQAFQKRHGLAPDGVLGKATYAALTTSFARRERQIDLTLERWRWLPPFQTPPIVVNIPQYHLYAFATPEDRVAGILDMGVIVGRAYPSSQTPVFEANMSYLEFRPYWNVPYSITKNEMLPKIRANPHYLAAQRLEIVGGQQDSSPTLAPTPENIAALASGRLRLRQKPGADNALGLVKFMFPNRYNVYLHSTPAHRLFNETVRTFSHGCIRVSDPVGLAAYVLRNNSGDWTPQKIQQVMNGTQTQRVNLAQPINVLILYGTALATEAGSMMFFDDVYGHDKKLERELGLAPLP